MTNDTESAVPYKLSLTGDGISIDKEIDPETAAQVVSLVLGGAAPAGASSGPARPAKKRARRRPSAATGGEESKPARRRRPSGPGVVRDLSLRPSGKKSFADFVAEKQPKSHQQKQTVILYWLKHEAGLDQGITVDHVNTCYVEAGWRRPKDLAVSLRLTANKTGGWIDTSDASDLSVGPRGEDAVKHDLPKAKK